MRETFSRPPSALSAALQLAITFLAGDYILKPIITSLPSYVLINCVIDRTKVGTVNYNCTVAWDLWPITLDSKGGAPRSKGGYCKQ